MPDIKFSYDHVPTIRRFSQSEAFVRGLMGPFGSGKSSGCVIELVKIASQQKAINGKRRARVVCVRNTYRQLEDTTIKTLYEWLPPQHFGTPIVSEHRYIIDRLAPDLELEILFRALDRAEHVSNLLSAEYTLAWVNEAREVPWSVVKPLMGRVGRFPPAKDGGAVRSGLIMDTNPPDTDSWWYDLFEDKRPANVEVFKQPSGRSPSAENLPNLPANYYGNLVQTFGPDEVRCYVDGEYGYIKDGKPIYPEYVDSLHCQEVEYQSGVDIYRGWDFGLTPACVWAQVLPDGRFVVFDELCGEDIDIHTFGQAVLDRHSRAGYRGKIIDIGDPAGMQRSATARPDDAKSCFEVLRGFKIAMLPGDQGLPIRLGSIKRALQMLRGGRPLFVIHPRCTKLRKGFQGRYQYRRLKVGGAQERYEDHPDKNEYSHPHDALQYIGGRVFGATMRSRETRYTPVRTAERVLDAEMGY